ncbi:MAG: leucine-rich repeat protein [Bacteroidaceae bacterium]|nr:leucine-rich repeat protein [Bacteroidaceae bacterium]
MKRFLTLLAFAALIITANATVIQSGSCGDKGDNVTFVLNDDGTLVISGSGNMKHYSSYSNIPWYSNREKIIKVQIEDGVTIIGDKAFSGCSGLISITIPNSVTSIGFRAFEYCYGLISITIPNSVTYIGTEAFSGCTGLTSITIPNSVTSIGDGAFSGCSGLTSFEVNKDNPNYCAIDNVLFNKKKTELLLCIATKKVAYAIPNSVTSIGDYAFSGCSGLTSITIPNSVTSIGRYAFSKCFGLTSVTIPNSVTNIRERAFDQCTSLTSVTIPNSVTSIGERAFYWCSSLTSVTIPNSVTSIGDYAFYYCSGLTSVTIPNSVTSIGNSAFTDCSKIKTIYWNTNVSYYFSSYVEEIYYGDDVTIAYPLVSSPKINRLNKVVLGKNVEYIRANAFKGAPLKEFYITGEKDIYLYSGVFDNVNVSNCTLYVPKSRAEYYETTAPWKDFGKIVDLDGNEFPEITKKQCEAPSVVYTDGHLKFSSTTPNATYSYTITDNDIKTSLTKSTSGDIPLSTTYNITVYAEAEGYETSDATTKTIQFGSNSGTEDVDALKEQIKSLEAQNSALESENTSLKETIKKYAEGDLNLDGRTDIDDVVYLLNLDSYSSDDDALALLIDKATAVTLSDINSKYGDVEFYTLNGVKVDIPNQTGIYIVKKNGETKMVVVKK